MSNLRMIRNHLRGLALVLAGGFLVVCLGGCRTDAQTGTLLGSTLGSGLGAIIGYQSGSGWEGAAIGAGAGALTGYIIGNESDRQKLHPYYDARQPSSYNANYDY